MKSLLFCLSVMLLIIISCSSTNNLNVKTNFENNGEIEKFQNLVFTFDKPVAAQKEKFKWDTTRFIDFSPKVEGAYQWTDSFTLVFSPSYGFDANTKYKAVLNNGLITENTEFKSLGGENVFYFNTQMFAINNLELFWGFSQTEQKQKLQALVDFNSNLNFNNLSTKIEVIINGNQQRFSLEQRSSSSIELTILPEDIKELADKDILIKVKMSAAVNSSEDNNEIIEFKSKVTSPENFMISNIETFQEGFDYGIKLTTNQLLNQNNDYKSKIKVTPSVEFTVQCFDNELNISGVFELNKEYKVTVDKSLKSAMGYSLSDEYSEVVTFGSIQPVVAFADSKGFYLSKSGDKLVEIMMAGISKVKVEIYKIYDNNIQSFLRQGINYNGYYDEAAEEYYDYRFYDTEYYGEIIYSKSYNLKELKSIGNNKLLSLDFNDKSGFDGIYVVVVKSENEFWVQESKIISISDIGIIAKKSKTDFMVFLNSIYDSQPVADAQVKLYSKKNQHVLTGRTNSEGVAVFKDIDKQDPPIDITLVSVRSGNDMNYLFLEYDNSAKFESDETGGINPDDYKLFLYGPRHIYRPGDSINISGIVRTYDWKTIAGMPVNISLLSPTSKKIKQYQLNLNSEGSFDLGFVVPTSSITGTYQAQVSLSNNVVLGSYSFRIEDFMPERIKVNLKRDKDLYKLTEKPKISINAMNYYGTPAAGRKFEVSVITSLKELKSKQFPDYNFNTNSFNNYYSDNEVFEGNLDEQGNAVQEFQLSDELSGIGYAEASASVSVFDESGRTVTRRILIPIQTQDAYLGIGYFDNWIGTNQNINIPIAAVKNDGTEGTQEARIEVVKYVYNSILRRSSGDYYYDSQENTEIVANQTIKINGKYNFSFKPLESGKYRIKIYAGNSPYYVSETFYAYGKRVTDLTSFEISKEGRIEMTADKDVYNLNEEAKILFKTPFNGNLLVAVERNGIHDYFNLKAENRTASLTLKLREEHIPNVYITAILYKSSKDVSIPLNVAYGVLPLMIENKSKKIPVEIIAASKTRSRTKQNVKIKTIPQKDVFVTLAAVDEGILSITNYKALDPFDYFYQKVALGVQSYSVYPKVLPEFKSSANYGGDGGEFGSMDISRVNPFTNKRVKLLSYWSGILQTNSSGVASVDIDIPEFSGSVKLMAVAYKGDKFGSGEAAMTVSDPVIITAGMPRFLSPGDKVSVPVTLSNTTNKAVDLNLTFEHDSFFNNLGKDNQTVKVNANSEKVIWNDFKVADKVGITQFKVKAAGNGETFQQNIEISVRPLMGLVKDSKSGIVEAGKSEQIDISNNYITNSFKGNIVLSRSPAVMYLKNYEFLTNYPYGCTEQIISSAFPQLAYKDLYELLNKNQKYNDNRAIINYAIEKINSRIANDGGIMLWDNSPESNYWVSAYSLHFLYECQRMGYSVNTYILSRLKDNLKDKIAASPMVDYSYFKDNKWQSRKYVPREDIYSLFVLALTGSADITNMNYYSSNPDQMTEDSKYLLSAAFQLIGQKQQSLNIIPASYKNENYQRESGGSLSSPFRNLALALYTLAVSEPNNSQIPALTSMLSKQLMSNHNLTTQENVFALLALAKVSKADKNNFPTGNAKLDNQELLKLTSGKQFVTADFNKAGKININSEIGRIYYSLNNQGISKSNKKETKDNFISIRRTYFDRFGNPINGSRFKQGDLILVKLDIKALAAGSRIDNVVITDMLPAGFEIENPRLNSTQLGKFKVKDFNDADYFDYRDDRINIFTDLTGNATYYYTVRAVSKGTYNLGAASVDAMYNPDYYSYSGFGEIIIE